MVSCSSGRIDNIGGAGEKEFQLKVSKLKKKI